MSLSLSTRTVLWILLPILIVVDLGTLFLLQTLPSYNILVLSTLGVAFGFWSSYNGTAAAQDPVISTGTNATLWPLVLLFAVFNVAEGYIASSAPERIVVVIVDLLFYNHFWRKWQEEDEKTAQYGRDGKEAEKRHEQIRNRGG